MSRVTAKSIASGESARLNMLNEALQTADIAAARAQHALNGARIERDVTLVELARRYGLATQDEITPDGTILRKNPKG